MQAGGACDSKHLKNKGKNLEKIKTQVSYYVVSAKAVEMEVAHPIAHLYAAVVMFLQTIVTFLSRVISDSRP